MKMELTATAMIMRADDMPIVLLCVIQVLDVLELYLCKNTEKKGIFTVGQWQKNRVCLFLALKIA